MADGVARESGRNPIGSQDADAGDLGLARGAAGSETGAKPQVDSANQGDAEERRETQQVQRPASDGMGEGLVKDQS